MVTARREEIDSGTQRPSTGRFRRYTAGSPAYPPDGTLLTDFAGSWLTFLNSIRWKKEDSLSGVLDQLTLMADARQSPLIAPHGYGWYGEAAAGRKAVVCQTR